MDYFRHYTRESFRTTSAGRKIAFSLIGDNPLWTAPEPDEHGPTRFLSSLGFGKPYIAAFEEQALKTAQPWKTNCWRAARSMRMRITVLLPDCCDCRSDRKSIRVVWQTSITGRATSRTTAPAVDTAEW